MPSKNSDVVGATSTSAKRASKRSDVFCTKRGKNAAPGIRSRRVETIWQPLHTASVNVSNTTTSVAKDTTPPVVSISNPVGGTVTGNVSVSISASDNAGAAGIKLALAIDGVTKAQGAGGSLGYSWNTKKSAAGAHTLTVTARDAAGNTSTATVNVSTR